MVRFMVWKTVSVAVILCIAIAGPCRAEPQPGDVYREYIYLAKGGDFEIVAGSQDIKESDQGFKNKTFTIESIKLANATKAEVRGEIWSGHINTDKRMISINNKSWITLQDNPIPNEYAAQPAGAIGRYMSFIYASTTIPLDNLQEGSNVFKFECEGGEWELFDFWAIIFRIYYDSSKVAHPTGTITSPNAKSKVNGDVQFTVTATSANSIIKNVYYLGWYADFNYTRDGVHQNWQYRTYHGVPKEHVGTATSSPWSVTWKTDWIPDQTLPMKFQARITDANDITFVTPLIDSVALEREAGTSVELCKAFDIPMEYIAHPDQPKSNKFKVTGTLAKATAAKAYIVTYNGLQATEVAINGNKEMGAMQPSDGVAEGSWFNYASTHFDVPVAHLKAGDNTASVATTDNTEHGVDVTWPGIEVKVQYKGLPVDISSGKARKENAAPFRLAPAADGFVLQSRTSGEYRIVVYSALGSMIKAAGGSEEHGQLHIRVPANGLYFIDMKTAEGRVTEPMIIGK